MPRAWGQLKLYVPNDIDIDSPDGNPITVNYPSATTTGGKPPVKISYSQLSGTLFPVGNTLISVQAKSKDGQIVPGAFIIRVGQPVVSPPLTITCPSNINTISPDGNPVIVNYPPATVSGGTPPYNISYNPPSGSLFPVDTTTVNVNVTDTSNPQKSASCSFTVRVTSAVSRIVIDPANDMTFVGVIRPPDALGTQPKPMTSRRVNGEFRLIHWGSASGAPCIEWVPGNYTPSQSHNYFDIPQALPFRTYQPNIYGTYGGFGWEPGSHTSTTLGDMVIAFLRWVEAEKALYYGFTSYYNNDASGSCLNIGKCLPNADESVWTTQGLWFTDIPIGLGGFGNRWTTSMVELPAWLSSVFGGRQLAIGGGGGYWQGIFGNNISQGPTMFPMFYINPAAQPYGEKLASSPVPALHHPYYAPAGLSPAYPTPYNNMYTQSPRIGRRAPLASPINKYGNPNNTNPYPGAPDDPWLPDPPANGGATYYTTSDQNHAMCYVDGPNLHGVLFAATLSIGNVDTRVSAATLFGTGPGGSQYYKLTVTSTAGITPNMFMYLEDFASPHYGGWLCQVQHPSNSGPYNTNLGDGNTNNPILSATEVLVFNFEEPVWSPNITGNNKFCAGQWYGGGGGKSASFETWVASYDPNDIAAQANVLDGDYSRPNPKYWGKFDYFTRRSNFIGGYGVPGCTAIEIDYVAKRAYFNVQGADLGNIGNAYQPLVYVYDIPGL